MPSLTIMGALRTVCRGGARCSVNPHLIVDGALKGAVVTTTALQCSSMHRSAIDTMYLAERGRNSAWAAEH